VICNSRRTRDDVIDRIGADPSRAHVVYYGSDPARFSLVDRAAREAAKRALGCLPERPLVGFVGALGDRRKAFDVMFAAWTDLCHRPDWDAGLVVAGAGSELPRWRQRAHDAGVAARVRFVGFRTDMPDIFAALDVLVHPARYEAYGLSVHEALCRGVPALVSRSAGVAERYPADLDDLLIADPDDASALADSLVRWRRRAEDVRCRVAPLSRALRARTWDTMAAEIVALVERAGDA
jgi:glycosyltransferase involved in cell wall biosynthesis